MSDLSIRTCHFLNDEQFRIAENSRQALGKTRDKDDDWKKTNNSEYGWAKLCEVTGPCPMWYVPWYYDPGDPEKGIRRDAALSAIADGSFGTGERNYYLSKFYWQQWSHIRPPICVLCPNGAEWCVDAKSSNGEGWNVTGEPPLLTCTPSILVPGYHGFLQNGVFTENM